MVGDCSRGGVIGCRRWENGQNLLRNRILQFSSVDCRLIVHGLGLQIGMLMLVEAVAYFYPGIEDSPEFLNDSVSL